MAESKTVKYDTHDRIYSISIWQDYNGTKWSNISTGILPEGLGAHTQPKGSKPKSLFWKFKKTYSSTLDVTNAIVVLHINPKGAKALPIVKAFVGDSNAPYNNNPKCTIKTPYKYIESTSKESKTKGYHLAYYKLTNITRSDLTKLIIECDWSKTSASDIGIGFLGVNVYTESNTNKINLTSTLSTEEAIVGDEVVWKITAKQNGNGGSGDYSITVPYGFSNTPIVSGGTFSNGLWSLTLSKGKTASLTYKFKTSMVGIYECMVHEVRTLPLTPKLIINDYFTVSDKPIVDRDEVTYTFFNDIGAEEEGRYFEVHIKGENSQSLSNFYTLEATRDVDDGNILRFPLYQSCEVLNDSYNIDENTLLDIYQTTPTTPIGNNVIGFNTIDNGEYYLHLKVPIYSNISSIINVITTQGSKSWSDNFFIQPYKSPNYNIQCLKGRIVKTSQVSVNIGLPNIWTIRCKAHNHNFHEVDDGLLNIKVEGPVAYIGSVQLTRCHSDDVVASVKNTLIRNRYLNRAYYGKKGDYTEAISMKLRMPPKDVVALQGFCEFDKPVPIDIIPDRWDGDPLNHRGWAELYEINNIKKINSSLYECEPVVDYLTHEINTKFTVAKGEDIYPSGSDSVKYPSVHTYLTQTHNFGDDLSEFMSMSPTSNQTKLDTTDGVASVYCLEPNSMIVYESWDYLSNFANYEVKFRNTLPVVDSEDYDDNWEMSVRLKDDERTIVEHTYHKYKHQSTENGLNKCAVTDTIWNGTGYEVINHENMSLNVDDLAPLLLTNKHKTELSHTLGGGNLFTLRDNTNNNVLTDMLVHLTIEDEYGYKETWDKLTDGLGNIYFDLIYPNGDYTITAVFDETDKYVGCESSFEETINSPKTSIYFNYDELQPFIATDSTFECSIGTWDITETVFTGEPNLTVYYAFGDISDDYFCGLQSVVSDSNGVLNIPITYNNGTKKLKLWFKGNNTYQPAIDEEYIEINIPNNDYTIEADNIEYAFNQSDKTYYGRVTRNNVAVSEASVKVIFSKDNETHIELTTSNADGSFSVPVNLGFGLWRTDVIINNCAINRKVTIKMSNKTQTKLTYSKEFALDYSQVFPNGLFNATLTDYLNNPLPNQKVRFKVMNGDNVELECTAITDSNGKAVCPYYSEDDDVLIYIDYDGGTYLESCDGVARVSKATGGGTVDTGSWESQKAVEVTVNGTTSIISQVNPTNRPIFTFKNVSNQPINGLECMVVMNEYIESQSTSNINVNFVSASVGQPESTVVSTKNGSLLLPTFPNGTYTFDIYYKDPSNIYKGGHTTIEMTFSNLNNSWGYSLISDIAKESIIVDKVGKVSFNVNSPLCNGSNIRVTTKNIDTSGTIATYNVPIINQKGIFYVKSSELPRNQGAWIDVFFTSSIYSGLNEGGNLGGKINSTLPLPSITLTQETTGKIAKYKLIASKSEINSFKVIVTNINTNETTTIIMKPSEEGISYIEIPTPTTDLYEIIFLFDDIDETLGQDVKQFIVQGVGNTLSNSLPVDQSGNIIVTPEPSSENAELTFGSDLRFELRDGTLNLIDYGMLLNSDSPTGGKIVINDIKLNTSVLKLECEVKYGNIYNQRLYNLDGLLQVRAIENKDVDANTIDMYSKMVCSPSPVPDNLCYFTRRSEDGTLYYFKETDLTDKTKGVSYIGSAYNNYKGGVDLQTSEQISIFNLENNYSPVYLNNGLIRVGFHKRSGYIALEKYNEYINEFIRVNVLKLNGNPKLELVKYLDDKIILKFGETTWTMWRGHPYVQVQHENNSFRILNTPNRVYCEISENEQQLNLLQELDVYCGEFSPIPSIQLFPKKLNIGENISQKNFELLDFDTNYNVQSLTTEASLTTEYDTITNDAVLKITSEDDVALNFPVDDFIDKPSNQFTVLFENVQGATPTKIRLRGFDKYAKISQKEGIQSGIYQDTQTITPTVSSENSSFRVTFNNVPDEVKAIDFIIYYENGTSFTSRINHLMLSVGEEEVNWTTDNTEQNINRSEIKFDKTYYANLYNTNDEFGLSVIRPLRNSFTLKEIKPSTITILAPYLTKCKNVDDPRNLLIEYVQSKEQYIDIDWMD